MDFELRNFKLEVLARFRINLLLMLLFSAYVIYGVVSKNSFDFILAYNVLIAQGGYRMLKQEHKKVVLPFLLAQVFLIVLDYFYQLEYYEFVLLANILCVFNYLLIYKQALEDRMLVSRLMYQYFTMVSFCLAAILMILNAEVIWFLIFDEMIISFVNFSVLGIQSAVVFTTLMTLVITFSQHPAREIKKTTLAKEAFPLSDTEAGVDLEDETVQLIVDFFTKDTRYLAEDFSLKKLAECLDIDTIAVVTDALNKRMDSSFYLVLSKYRIISAMRMMEEEPSATVVSISKRCGFKSVSTFNKYFNLYVGMTPTAYKEQLLA